MTPENCVFRASVSHERQINRRSRKIRLELCLMKFDTKKPISAQPELHLQSLWEKRKNREERRKTHLEGEEK